MRLRGYLFGAVLAGMVANQAYAATASSTLSVGGQVNSATCVINGITQNGSNVSTLAMALPKMPVAALSSAGKTSDLIVNSAATINLTSCPVSTNVALTLADSYTLYNASYSGWNNSSTTGAKNIVIQLYDVSNGSPVILQSAVANTKTTSTAGAANWIIAARYYATGVATAGIIQSKADFTITYP